MKPASASYQSSNSTTSSKGSASADLEAKADAEVDPPPRARRPRATYVWLSDGDGNKPKAARGREVAVAQSSASDRISAKRASKVDQVITAKERTSKGRGKDISRQEKQETGKPVKVNPAARNRPRDDDTENDHGSCGGGGEGGGGAKGRKAAVPCTKFKGPAYDPPASKQLEVIPEDEVMVSVETSAPALRNDRDGEDLQPSSDSGTRGWTSKKRRQEGNKGVTETETLGKTTTRKRSKVATEAPSLSGKPKKRAPAKLSKPAAAKTADKRRTRSVSVLTASSSN